MTTEKTARPLNRFYTLVIITGIAAMAAFLISRIYASEPTAQREDAVKKTPMLVEVMQVQRGTFTPGIRGLGNVQPVRDIMFAPRISGQVIEVSDRFMPGSLIKKGEVFLKIDPSDYQHQVTQMESALQQAESALAIELGRRDVAEKEYALMNREITGGNRALVLREPQMAAARAAVQSARAALDQARSELTRTRIKAPFDAQIISPEVNLGSQVDPDTPLA
ncbi:MAG: hypothetical protein MI863_16535, partial [Desulfobacterales bacterium]|nr:hypothetical protein [Desulfobacterales bacterium]